MTRRALSRGIQNAGAWLRQERLPDRSWGRPAVAGVVLSVFLLTPIASPPPKALFVWGGVDAGGHPFLEPAFVIDAPPALPPSRGEYRLSVRAHGGQELFSFSFDMPEVADGDRRSSFAFVLAAQASWEADLASITLSGPGGSFTLDGESDLPMAILRDRASGQIREILRDLPPTVETQADAEAAVGREPRTEVLFSRGIPGADAWRR